MSVSSALNTAVSGLTAQSVALSNLSNNISNSQTIGYKTVDTSFSDYVEASGALEGQSGNVMATTQYANQTNGPITSSTANGALAINGNGFFAVNEISGQSSTSTPSLSATQYYTRAGDFSSNKDGYLVNSAGEYLDGYMASATTGVVNTGTLTPINVNNVVYRPTATTTVTAAATVPGSSTLPAVAATPSTSNETVYDSLGAAHTLGMTWTQTAGATATTSGTYTLSVTGAATSPASATVAFNPDGTLQSITSLATGSTTLPAGTSVTAAGAPASFDIGPVGLGNADITLNLGTVNPTSGGTGTMMNSTVGATFSGGIAAQDGTASGTQTGFNMETDGSVMATFDNGETQLIGKVPLAIFGNANALQAQDGQAYTATAASGAASMQLAATNGAGGLETKAIEGSNTSLDTDLTKLIVAQQAYGTSAKVVTTADEMLQTALSMKQ